MADSTLHAPGPITQHARTNTDNRIDAAIAETLVALITGDLTPAEAVTHIQYLCAVSAQNRSTDTTGLLEHLGPTSDVVQEVLARA